MSERTQPAGGIFLSYAREDKDAARRIAEALRAVGLVVWFDENELRGGDAWDAQIRQKIRECALFVPIISAQTQARAEGYFRREWKLADGRTEDMGRRQAFLVPVCIDDTDGDEADVPDSFLRAQWTRLPGALPTPDFVAQVKRLLEAPKKPSLKPDQPRPPTMTPEFKEAVRAKAEAAAMARAKPAVPAWAWGVTALVVIAAGAGAMFFRPPAPAAPPPAPVEAAKPAPVPAPKVADKSIAVLPFENMSEDKDNAFFTQGVHEDILTNLSFLHDLRVVSRTSVMQYRGTTKSVRQIAAELGVTYILEGSVRRSGTKVRVTGQLIHAATDEHVWAKAYDRDLTDVFAIQAELAQAIAAALSAAISPAEKSLLERKPTDNPVAYDLYVKARAAYAGNATSLETEEKWLLEAVHLDPNFAQAWAQLAALHAGRKFNDLDTSAARLENAKAAIETAVRLAPDDPVVIEMQGDYFYYGYRDYTRAAEQYRRLLTLRPNSPEAFGSLGLIYRRQGRWNDTVENFRKALELDPRNNRYRGALASQLFAVRQYEAAAAELERGAATAPGELLWKLQAVTIPFFAHGTTTGADAWLATLQPRPEEAARVRDMRKQWARLRGDFATALRLDGEQPYFDDDDLPRWQQDFYTAFDYLGAGDLPAARARLDQLRPQLRTLLEKQPSNNQLWVCSGLAAGVLGDRDAALAAEHKLAELLPESADAVNGPGQSLSRAQILAWAGHKDQALAELARLLQTPYGANVCVARFDAGWLPLHGDPRFEALLADPKNNAPLF